MCVCLCVCVCMCVSPGDVAHRFLTSLKLKAKPQWLAQNWGGGPPHRLAPWTFSRSRILRKKVRPMKHWELLITINALDLSLGFVDICRLLEWNVSEDETANLDAYLHDCLIADIVTLF